MGFGVGVKVDLYPQSRVVFYGVVIRCRVNGRKGRLDGESRVVCVFGVKERGAEFSR